MVEDELGSPSSRTPTESTVQRHHMGLYAGMVVAMLLTISFILMLFIDRGIRRQPDIPEALRPPSAAATIQRRGPTQIDSRVTPKAIVIELEIDRSPIDRPATPTSIPGRVESPARYLLITVHPGDTLAAIASRHGHEFEEIAALNGIDEPYLIQVGDELLLPNR